MQEQNLKNKTKRGYGEEFPGGLVVKNMGLSLLSLGFNHWLENFHMPQAQPKEKKNSNNKVGMGKQGTYKGELKKKSRTKTTRKSCLESQLQEVVNHIKISKIDKNSKLSSGVLSY